MRYVSPPPRKRPIRRVAADDVVIELDAFLPTELDGRAIEFADIGVFETFGSGAIDFARCAEIARREFFLCRSS